MSNSEPSVNSNFHEHELRDTSLDSGRDEASGVSTPESNLPKSKEVKDQYALGIYYLQERQYSWAINAYKRALELEPDCAAVHHSLGLAYYKEGDFEPARDALQKAITLNPQNANYHYVLGQLLEDDGAWEDAISEFTGAIELDPAYIEAWYNRGLLYDRLGALEKARDDFKQVIAQMPTFHAARHNLGILYIKQRQWEEAKQVFEETLEIDPQDADAHYHLADIYLNRYGDVDRAIHSLQYAIKCDPDHLDARFELGLLYAKSRYAQPERRQNAIDQFIELIKRNNDLQTFQSLDRLFFILGSLYDDEPNDADLAIYAYRAGLEHSSSAQARNNLGLLYLQKDLIDLAAEEFKQAIQLEPDYETPYYNLAKLYFYERDEEILKDLQRW
ncbi:MAG: tetratricopeptide repeat protein, partial [Candidatus Poribacteria bacterium]|nr:tetratricopeptide repeat protein [Candidatus Poribacteria bacterium]